MKTTEERKIIKEAQRGSTAAFALLYKQHKAFVYNICFRELNNHEDAEDFVHDVFLRVFRCIWQFRGESSFTTWLYRTTSTILTNSLRTNVSRYRRKMTIDIEAVIHRLVSPDQANPEKCLELAERAQILHKALLLLTPKIRETIILHYLEGHQNEDIARRFGITDRAARCRSERGMVKLRKFLRAPKLPRRAS